MKPLPPLTIPPAASTTTTWRQWLTGAGPSWLILAIGLAAVSPLYFSRAYVPDEAWFRDVAAEKSVVLGEQGLWRFIRTQENELGYGALYWIVYALLGRWFDEPIVVARGLALASMATAPVGAALLARKHGSSSGWLAVALWFTFPIAWWTGKLTGPETYSLAASTIGATLILWGASGRLAYAAGVALGLACGIKLTAAPVVVFAGVVMLIRGPRRGRATALLSAGLIGGFIVANPFLLFRPKHFLETLAPLADAPSNLDASRWSIDHLAHLYWNNDWEWDRVFQGGLLNWSLAAPALVLWLALLCRCPRCRGPLTALAAALACTTCMLMVQSRYLGWYWFPIVALIPLATCVMTAPPRFAAALSASLLLGNVAFNQPCIRAQLAAKAEHLAALDRRMHVLESVDLQLSQQAAPLDRLVWCVPPGLVGEHVRAPTHATTDFQTSCELIAYEWIRKLEFAADAQRGKHACIVLHQPFRELWTSQLRLAEQQNPGKLEVREIATREADVSLLFLRRR